MKQKEKFYNNILSLFFANYKVDITAKKDYVITDKSGIINKKHFQPKCKKIK